MTLKMTYTQLVKTSVTTNNSFPKDFTQTDNKLSSGNKILAFKTLKVELHKPKVKVDNFFFSPSVSVFKGASKKNLLLHNRVLLHYKFSSRQRFFQSMQVAVGPKDPSAGRVLRRAYALEKNCDDKPVYQDEIYITEIPVKPMYIFLAS